MARFTKGHKLNNGRTPWNKGLKEIGTGKDNGMWKGDEVGYVSLHKWVQRWKGKPTHCENCGKEGNGYEIHWANIDHTYRRVLEDYIALCVKCHHDYDREHNGYTR